MKTMDLKKGDLFRVSNKDGLGPEVWTWDGEYQHWPFKGAIIRRLSDGFRTTIPVTTPIALVPPIEDL